MTEYVDVQAAADYHGVHHSTIRDWIHRGLLPASRYGRPNENADKDHRRIRIRVEDLDAPLRPIDIAD